MAIDNLEFLKNLAKSIHSVFGERCEVVLHDFSDLQKSIVHIEGNITGRPLESPIPDMIYRLIKEHGSNAPEKYSYKSKTNDGKLLKCSTNMIKNKDGELAGCLCINFDVTDFNFIATAFKDFNHALIEAPCRNSGKTENDADTRGNNFAISMESAVDFAVADYGKTPSMMSKTDRICITQNLEKDGVFVIKGSVDYAARSLGTTRYTIYNYLKQIRK